MQKAKSKLPAAKAAGNVKHANDVFNQVSLLWQLGDWQALSAFDQTDFDASSNAGYCYLYVAIANFQLGDSAAGKALISKAIAAGVEPTTATKMLLSSIYNNFGNMAFLNQNEPAAMANYQYALQLLNGFEASKSHLNTRVKNQLELIAHGTDAAFKRSLVNQSYYFNALDYRNLVFDALYLTPKYYDSPVSASYLPVAYWLVAALRPDTVLSLAADSAAFHFAMCQAMVNSSEGIEGKKLYLDTSCLDEDTLAQAQAHQQKWYSGLSELCADISDNTAATVNAIDLLTIDNCQSMQQLSNIIAQYRNAFSSKACVLVNTEYFKFNEPLLAEMAPNGCFSFDLDKKLVLIDFSQGVFGPVQQLCALEQDYSQKFEFMRLLKFYATSSLQNYSNVVGVKPSPRPTTTEVQLFIPDKDTGAYTEQNSIRKTIELNQWQSIIIPFEIPILKQIRFDPASFFCMVEIEYISIKSGDSEVCLFLSNSSNSFKGLSAVGSSCVLSLNESVFSILSHGNDPIIIASLGSISNNGGEFYFETRLKICDVFPSLIL